MRKSFVENIADKIFDNTFEFIYNHNKKLKNIKKEIGELNKIKYEYKRGTLFHEIGHALLVRLINSSKVHEIKISCGYGGYCEYSLKLYIKEEETDLSKLLNGINISIIKIGGILKYFHNKKDEIGLGNDIENIIIQFKEIRNLHNLHLFLDNYFYLNDNKNININIDENLINEIKEKVVNESKEIINKNLDLLIDRIDFEIFLKKIIKISLIFFEIYKIEKEILINLLSEKIPKNDDFYIFKESDYEIKLINSIKRRKYEVS